MRITGGLRRGFKIISPKDYSTRPMSDFVRESVFNILRNEIEDKLILDIFSGTGVIGLEALSRGAKFCTFVENGNKIVNILKENVKKLKFENNSKIITKSAFFLAKILENEKFDLFFLDPPFALIDNPVTRKEFVDFTSSLIKNFGKDNGKVIIHYRKNKMEGFPFPPIFLKKDKRTYGINEIMFLEFDLKI